MACNFSLVAVEREESAFLFHPKNAAVTGAFSYTGRYVARRLLDQGVSVRTLTRNIRKESPFGGLVKACPLDFSDPDVLRRSMEGAGVLYNTYWVRFGRGETTFDQAVENSKTLFDPLPTRELRGSSTFQWPTPRRSPGYATSGARAGWRSC